MPDTRVPGRSRETAVLAATVAAVVIVLGAAVVFVPFFAKQRLWRASVADATAERSGPNVTAVSLSGRQEVCMSSVTIARGARIASFGLFPAAHATEPPLTLLLSGSGYRSIAQLPSGGYGSLVEFQIAPPRRSLIGTACLMDRGSLPSRLTGQPCQR
jgi:hypothetical protein